MGLEIVSLRVVGFPGCDCLGAYRSLPVMAATL
mgnify:CR=1 FL=1